MILNYHPHPAHPVFRAMDPFKALFSWLLLLVVAACGRPAGVSSEAAPPPDHPAPLMRVALVNDTRLPAFTRDSATQALDRAANLIDRCYGVKPRFEIVCEDTLDSFLASIRQPLPEHWQQGLHRYGVGESLTHFSEAQIHHAAVHQNLYTPATLRRLLGPDSALIGEDTASNIRALLKFGERRIEALESIRCRDGLPLFAGRSEAYSLWYWEAYLRAIDPESVAIELILMNAPLFEQDYREAPPHTVIRGGLVCGLSEPEARQAIVSTFALWCADTNLQRWRDAELSENERLQALAQIIAHEVGAHGIRNYDDTYDHPGCLANPCQEFDFKLMMAQLEFAPPCTREHVMLDTVAMLVDRYGRVAGSRARAGRLSESRAAVDKGLVLAPRDSYLRAMRSWLLSAQECERRPPL